MTPISRTPVPYVLITLKNAEEDAVPVGENRKKIAKPSNNGRKVFATAVMHQFGEELITDPVWKAPQVFPSGEGGIEIATFTEFSGQDRHKHDRGTEIYTVLRGTLRIYINDVLLDPLLVGDEIVIPPGTVHQIVQETTAPQAASSGSELLVRVHSISCYGVADKYVQLNSNGPWLKWSGLSKTQRSVAYKK